MCCFSQPVKMVADTNIFARASTDGRQFLVYSMKFESAEDLAMILPIPTPKDSAEDAVNFISLQRYGAFFFVDMRKGFPDPFPPQSLGGGGFLGRSVTAPLAVVEVGDFVASFVPALKDFVRLDTRFRLPEGVWANLPQYQEFGFAVFKLKKPKPGTSNKVHPMAFEFPRADPGVLFFPTVHIHEGWAYKEAMFDHALFCQVIDEGPARWAKSRGPAESFMKVWMTEGIVDGGAPVYRMQMRGIYENTDVLV
jgi:hypothetical protein